MPGIYTVLTIDEALGRIEGIDAQGGSPAPAGRVIARLLREHRAVSVVRESEYLDRDYLRAYTSFYGTFFRRPSKYVERFHFFAEPITDDQLDLRLPQDTYLGFCVLWPTDPTVIGRSLLRPPTGPGHRSLLVPRTAVHIGGCELFVDAPPYATKDFGVAACASVATWLATELGAGLHNLPRSSSSDITLLAAPASSDMGRPLPQRFGLTTTEIMRALHSLGYEPFVYDLTSERFAARGTIYGYLASNIPLILMVTLPGREPDATDRHALLAVGYDFDFAQADREKRNAAGLTHLIVHDDRHGPYVLGRLDTAPASLPTIELHYVTGTATAVVHQIVVPLPPKIYTISQEAHIHGQSFLGLISGSADPDSEPVPLHWPFMVRTRLVEVTSLKRESRQWTQEGPSFDLRSQSLPRRVWLSEAISKPLTVDSPVLGRVVIDPSVLRDATASRYLWAHWENTIFDVRSPGA